MNNVTNKKGLAMLAGPFLLFSLTVSGSGLAADNATALPGPELVYDLKSVSQVTASADGSTIAWVKQRVNDEKTGRNSSIWLHRNGETPYRFTHNDSDRAPVISPNGKTLVFSSGRDNGTALYHISLQGGEAQQLLKPEQGSVSVADWHPHGSSLLLSVNIEPGQHPMEKAESDEGPQADVTIVTDAVYKRQGGYQNENRSSLWLMNLSDNSLQKITPDGTWNHGSGSFSPNGECIAYTSNRSTLAADGEFSQQLFSYCGEQEVALTDVEYHASQPQWIDDSTLLYVRRTDVYEAPELMTVSLESGQSTVLTEAMDHNPGSLLVARGAAWFIADDRGSRTLNRVNLETGDYTPVAGRGYSLANLVINDAIIVATREHEALPAELVSLNEVYEPTIIQAPNSDLVDHYALQRYEVFQAKNERGDVLDIFFLPPAGLESGSTSQPVILNIKGGPGGMWGHQWFHENQIMAARGYAVVFVNYRGSTGYGYDHQSQVRLDYGGADYRDNMVAINAALERYDWIDPERVFITGGSHGGFLTNWATTQSNLFRAAVTQRSVSNWISEAGTQAFPPISMRREFGGTIWENYDYYWGRSPLKFANQVTAPTLIIHSTDDHITPIGQGEEWFYALKANDVPVELAVFSGEGHRLSRAGKPVNMVKRLELILEWFDRWDK